MRNEFVFVLVIAGLAWLLDWGWTRFNPRRPPIPKDPPPPKDDAASEPHPNGDRPTELRQDWLRLGRQNRK